MDDIIVLMILCMIIYFVIWLVWKVGILFAGLIIIGIITAMSAVGLLLMWAMDKIMNKK